MIPNYEMTISGKQVLQIETYLSDIFTQTVTDIRRFIWRHPQSINSSIRVDLAKQYTFNELQNYLLIKFPEDEMIKSCTEITMQLFQASFSGQYLCDIDKELLDLHENEESYRLSTESLKINLLNKATEYTGSTSFFILCLKNVIDEYIKFDSIIDTDLKENIVIYFLNYVNQFGDFIVDDLKLNNITKFNEINPSEFMKGVYEKLKQNTNQFVTGFNFFTYTNSCKRNDYIMPYSSNDGEIFCNDLFNFSIKEVIEIINQDTTEYFGFKLRKNESLFPRDLKNLKYGNINIFITFFGLINFTKILKLKNDSQLLFCVKRILSSYFKILSRESINDDYNPQEIITGNQLNSSIIVGKNLNQKRLYNQYLDVYHEKVIDGIVWYSDDVNGLTFDYLGFADTSDYEGEYQHSMPFENIIFKYYITYLNIAEIERDIDNLKSEGYWESKDQYNQELSDDFN